jgi:asparagine synthase (glutamine-hydrolysing)
MRAELQAGPESHCLGWENADASVWLAVAFHNEEHAKISESGGLVAACVGDVESSPQEPETAVVRAYQQAGIAGLRRLRGEYAYALWDSTRRSLFVGCDAVGHRGLVYGGDERTFLASSRATAILRVWPASRSWDRAYLAHALSGIWSRASSATAFEGISRNVGGELIEVSRSGVRHSCDDAFRFDVRVQDVKEATDELGRRLRNAVAGRFEARSSAVALSGGIDSAAVAAAIAASNPSFDAFTLVSREVSESESRDTLLRCFPQMHLHVVDEPVGDEVDALPVSDDPLIGGSIVQPGRIALLRAMRDAGHSNVFDGEGGDEVFDVPLRFADLLRERALSEVITSIRSGTSWRSICRDVLEASAFAPLAGLAMDRRAGNLRARHPWLRPSFWRSAAFSSAWDELAAFARLRRARDRLPEILGTQNRFWRAHDLARQSLGLAGHSPMLDRDVVELVGSLPARIALQAPHRKVLLRRFVEQQVGPELAWRPKREPLADWLIRRAVSNDRIIAEALSRIEGASVLSEFVDPHVVVTAARSSRDRLAGDRLTPQLAQLIAFVDWVARVEARYGVS